MKPSAITHLNTGSNSQKHRIIEFISVHLTILGSFEEILLNLSWEWPI